MTKVIAAIAVAVMMASVAFAGSVAQAAPGDNDSGYGGCVDNLYGNATNPRDSGNGVLPSQSPGPFVNTGFNEPPRDDQTMGFSMGDAMKSGTDAGLNGHETMYYVCLAP